jgi:hypothetical protein
MFENIKMFHLDLRRPITAGNFNRELSQYRRLPDYEGIDVEDGVAAFRSEFHLGGDISFLAPLPVSEFARQHFLSMQSFILIHGDGKYFTRRDSE